MSNLKKINQYSTGVLGKTKSREEVIGEITGNREYYKKYLELPDSMKEELEEFLEGKRSLNILYDNFFRKIFNPDEHRERVEKLISALIGQKVKIKAVLSREGSQLADKGSFVIMDIIVELEDGSFVDVEMQKTGYRFPSQRSSCYVSDMIMRQYNRRREEAGKKFSYKDITPVYLFVLMEESSEEFVGSKEYIHRREISYSSSIDLPETASITYITLDSFRKNAHNIDEELEAWLSFLIKDDLESVTKLIDTHPEFAKMYEEIAEFRKDPKELIGMFSEALYIMDRNTEKYMIDELKEEAKVIKQQLDESKQQLDESRQQLSETQQQLSESQQQLSESQQQLNESKQQLNESQQQLSESKQQLDEANSRAENYESRVRELEEVIAMMKKDQTQNG